MRKELDKKWKEIDSKIGVGFNQSEKAVQLLAPEHVIRTNRIEILEDWLKRIEKESE